MRRFLIAGAAVLTVGCSASSLTTTDDPTATDDPDRINQLHEVDVNAWRTTLVSDHGAIPDVNMADMYKLTVERCKSSPDELEMFVAVGLDQGSSPDSTRANMSFVCPGRAQMIDDALEQIQQTRREVDTACSIPPRMRTTSQQLLVATLGGC